MEKETAGLRSAVADHSEEASDESLVARAAAGDRAAYAGLVLRHAERYLSMPENA